MKTLDVLKICSTLFITSALIPTIAIQTSAESLWPAQGAITPVCSDKKAIQVGDIVTVVIVESTSSTQAASTTAKKSSSLSAGSGTGPLLEKIPLFGYSGNDSISGSGSTNRSSSLTTTMTAKVVRIEPNGNMYIEGSRFVQTNKEKSEVKLSGTIRPEDVSVDNTVQSTSIADAKITYVGSGPIGSRQKEGIINKIFKILF